MIPPEELGCIDVPTTLIWGRYDRANRLQIAEAASGRYGWPLHVIDNCADDPPRDQPEAFLKTLHTSLGSTWVSNRVRGDPECSGTIISPHKSGYSRFTA